MAWPNIIHLDRSRGQTRRSWRQRRRRIGLWKTIETSAADEPVQMPGIHRGIDPLNAAVSTSFRLFVCPLTLNETGGVRVALETIMVGSLSRRVELLGERRSVIWPGAFERLRRFVHIGQQCFLQRRRPTARWEVQLFVQGFEDVGNKTCEVCRGQRTWLVKGA